VRKAWLGYLALVVLVLAMLNFTTFFVTHTAPVPVWASHPLGMLAGGYLAFVFVFPSMLGRRGARRVLPPPGPPTAHYRCGGSIGRMRFSGRLITLTVYADRLTLSPILLGDCTIHGSDLRAVRHDRAMWQRTVIEHTAPDVTSPVTLYSLPEDIRDRLSAIRRDPLPAGWTAEAAPTPNERVRQNTGKIIELVLFAFGFLVGLGLIGYGVVQMIRTQDPFFLVWLAVALFIEIRMVREGRARWRA
jgi:hypothetical protein